MSDNPAADAVIAEVKSKSRGRTRYAGQAPFNDEILVAEIERLRAALTRIRECMGGDNPSGGWCAPEDVWGIATEALNGR